ncbi:MAG: peptidoglycan DD-metalloendopeptidase family protein [Steroidobacteraceae bacterium]
MQTREKSAHRWYRLLRSRAVQILGGAIIVAAWLFGREPASRVEPATGIAEPQAQAEVAPPEPATSGLPSIADHLRNNPAAASTVVTIARNDTLDGIFRSLQLSLGDLATLRAVPTLRAMLDRLHPGDALTLVHDGGNLIGLERQLSVSKTLNVARTESGFASEVLENPLEWQARSASGTITSSLFEATAKAGVSDSIALAMADIFAWDIDFVLDIRPGDSFSVVYEELQQDGKYVKDGAVIAASFTNRGREYRAVRYVDPEGNTQYYSPDGKSMRKAFLRAPLKFTRVSSRFNPNRRHPVLNRIRAHKGVDYAAPTGTPVRASGDGRVRFVGVRGGYGRVVELDHGHGIVTVYAHLSRFARGLGSGRKVAQGELVGYVGMTGLANGPHLHYEYRVNGRHRDPLKVPLPSADPVPERWRGDFEAQAHWALATLDRQGATSTVVAAR